MKRLRLRCCCHWSRLPGNVDRPCEDRPFPGVEEAQSSAVGTGKNSDQDLVKASLHCPALQDDRVVPVSDHHPNKQYETNIKLTPWKLSLNYLLFNDVLHHQWTGFKSIFSPSIVRNKVLVRHFTLSTVSKVNNFKHFQVFQQMSRLVVIRILCN